MTFLRIVIPLQVLLDFAIAFSTGQAIAFRLIETGFAGATGRVYPAVIIACQLSRRPKAAA